MTLEEIADLGIDWLKKNELTIFYGFIDIENTTRAICDTEELSISEFLKIGKTNNIGIFTVTKSAFKKEEVSQSIEVEELDSVKSKKLNTQLNKLAKFDNKLDYLSFAFILQNVVYSYSLAAKWSDDIEDIKLKIKDILEDDDLKAYREKREKTLPRAKVKTLGAKLAKKEEFFKKRHDYERLGLLILDLLEEHQMDEEELGWNGKTEIISEAKSFFERKLLKKKEMELIKEIATMKDQGMSKIAIRSKLEITEGMLNKYYYK